jgi:hypothetical protein
MFQSYSLCPKPAKILYLNLILRNLVLRMKYRCITEAQAISIDEAMQDASNEQYCGHRIFKRYSILLWLTKLKKSIQFTLRGLRYNGVFLYKKRRLIQQ